MTQMLARLLEEYDDYEDQFVFHDDDDKNDDDDDDNDTDDQDGEDAFIITCHYNMSDLAEVVVGLDGVDAGKFQDPGRL